jgi:hypothetical protein
MADQDEIALLRACREAERACSQDVLTDKDAGCGRVSLCCKTNKLI